MENAETTVSDGPTRLPSVTESVLRRHKSRISRKRKLVSNQLKNKKSRFPTKRKFLKRAEKFVHEFRQKEQDQNRLKRNAKTFRNSNVPLESKLLFVVRIRSINLTPPKVRKVLELLRLKKVNTGVFLLLNKATNCMLRICEPYVTWGYPNLKSVRELIYKKGYAMQNGKRTPISNNRMIQDVLGEFGIICTEDLVHSIFTVNESFNHASQFFAPFKLNIPTGGWKKTTTQFAEGGEYGNREESINKLLRRMI